MPIEHLSHTHTNTTLLRKVLHQAESQISPVLSIRCCENEIQQLLEVVQKYCERTSEPLTVSDKKFLEACKKNVHGSRPSFRPFVEQLQSSATQALAQQALAQPALAQPALALQQQAISLRLQAAQQEQQAISLRLQAVQQEQQAISLRLQAVQQEQQAPQPPTTAELMEQQLRAMDEEEENMQSVDRIQIIRYPSQSPRTYQVDQVYGDSFSSNSR